LRRGDHAAPATTSGLQYPAVGRGRNALKLILGEDQVAEIERQVESGKLSLADLNSLADKGKTFRPAY
jgi:hypothetical protein